MDVLKQYDKRREILLFVFLSGIIVWLRLCHISELGGPFLWTDEIAYWSHAANLAGLSWCEVVEAWYSYGYSLFLVPLFWFTHNMSILYRMAIILNALFGLCSFIIGMKLIQEMDKECSKVRAMLISFTAVCYSAYIFESNIAWSETLLYTWFLLMLLGAINFFKQGSWKNLMILTLEIAFLYMIHNRCIVVAVAWILILILMIIVKRIDWKKAVASVAILGLLYVFHKAAKAGISILMWGTVNGFSGNDMASHSGKLAMFFSLEGWKLLVQSFAGKLWYLLSASLMFVWFGGIYIAKKAWSEWKSNLFYIFLSLVICGTIAVTTVSMLPQYIEYAGKQRLDIYFYGRYSENVSGICIMTGMLYMTRRKNKEKYVIEYLSGLLVYLVCSVFLYEQIMDADHFWINLPAVSGIYFYEDFSAAHITRVVTVIYLVAGILCRLTYRQKQYIQTVRVWVLCLLSTSIFINVAQKSYDIYIREAHTRHSYADEICAILNANTEYQIYNLADYSFYKMEIRTQVVKGRMDFEAPKNPEDNSFFVCYATSDMDKRVTELSGKKLYFIASEGALCLFGMGDELAADMRAQGYEICWIDQWKPKLFDPEDSELYFLNGETEIEEEIILGDDLKVSVAVQARESSRLMVNDTGYNLSYHLYDKDWNAVYWDGERYAIPAFAGKAVVELTLDSSKFAEPGDYILEFDMVEEYVEWKEKKIRMNVRVLERALE